MQTENSVQKKHVTSYELYLMVWLALLALTSLTVSVAGIDLGSYTMLVALSIAAIKSGLVIYFFMHIKYEEPIFKVFLFISGITLVVIFILTAFDILYR